MPFSIHNASTFIIALRPFRSPTCTSARKPRFTIRSYHGRQDGPVICSFVGDLSHLASSKVPTLTPKHECPCKPRVRSEAPNRFFALPNVETKIDQGWSLEALNWDNYVAHAQMRGNSWRRAEAS